MTHYDSLKKHLAEIETSLEEDMAPFALQVEQLNSIYGISTTASCAIIAEIGIDMKPFKTAEHICSWAGLCPGNNESAGKRKSTSVTKGNPYIKSMLFRHGTGESNRKKEPKKRLSHLPENFLSSSTQC